MGARYLLDLDDVCRRTGYPVVEVGAGRGQTGSQWQYRSRSSGGYDNGLPNHIMTHHTASGPNADGWPDVNYMCFATVNLAKPTANLYIARAGVIYVMAGGATNTNGVGRDPCGATGDDSMNRAAIGIEAGNNGQGETWPGPQQDCYVKLCRELSKAYGITTGRIHSHFEWTSRKVDCAGQSRYATGANKWNMTTFRNDVAATPTTPPPTQPPPSGDWWTALMKSLPTLRKGNSGSAVKRMQHLIAAAGFMDPGNVANYDGLFGAGTESALKAFQGAAGGVQDGVCGPWTWGALMHTIDGIPTIKNGARGPDVERMQHLLAAAGFLNQANTANYDGVWGSGTESAKIKFDNAKGLTPSPPSDCGQGSWTRLLKG